MSFHAKSQAALVLTLALLTAGCAGVALPLNPSVKGTTPGATTPGGTTPGVTIPGANVTGPAHNLPLEPLNGVEFKPITAQASKFLSSNNQIVASGGGNLGSSHGEAASMATSASAGGGTAGMSADAGAPAMAPQTA